MRRGYFIERDHSPRFKCSSQEARKWVARFGGIQNEEITTRGLRIYLRKMVPTLENREDYSRIGREGVSAASEEIAGLRGSMISRSPSAFSEPTRVPSSLTA
jgi:hypothetical protein